ncbi:hypothetical protein DOTSEDRAFT_27299 [Dothistroma septosporum NZE10]|uniref:Uncharacterized protein n=1 Tax=Dothistroma septosporum (strain NZE10 / CBS 128990) TaxID=675120 RepID=N1PGL1_DOTSN|nr:hypothetical protein DOTSEDRAFT_27299 [Dothistroma septosporum NZE10]
MRTALIATAASLASVATARIVGFSVPSTVKPDSIVKLQITAEDYIQTTQDVTLSFGISTSKAAVLGSLGEYLDTKFLGPDFSNEVGNITHYVRIPATAAKGDYVIQGAHFELTGASISPATSVYYATTTVGDNTSADYVDSTLVPQSQ